MFMIFVFLANFVLSQEELGLVNISKLAGIKTQEEVIKEREEEVMTTFKWLAIGGAIFLFLVITIPMVFKFVRRALRRWLLYFLIFLLKHFRKSDEEYIRNRLVYLGFKRKHVLDATYRYRKKFGF